MKHNPIKIRPNIKQRKDGGFDVSRDTTVQVPEYFRKKELYVPDKDNVIKVMGSFAIIQGDNYAISEAPCYISLTPTEERTITLDNMDYIELYFPKGSSFMKNNKSIHDKIPYVELFVNYMLAGKVPWYLDYEDVVNLFLKGEQYAGLMLESRPETLEELHALGARLDDKETLVRTLEVKNPPRKRITPVALSNVAFGASTTLTKVTGSYQSDGLDHALVTTTTKLSAAEKIIRDIDTQET